MDLKQKKVKSTKPSKFNKPEKPLDFARREDMIRQSVERIQGQKQDAVPSAEIELFTWHEKTQAIAVVWVLVSINKSISKDI